jgi:hypothetical protein
VSPGSEKGSTAAAAADRVRAVLEAAEQSAAELRAEAAREIDAQLARAQEVTDRLSARAQQIESALQSLATTVTDELNALRGDLEELRAVSEGAGEEPITSAPPPPPAAAPAPPSATEPEAPAGARVIALNMALNGSPREETARYLSENFELDDPGALLDEVYARVSG